MIEARKTEGSSGKSRIRNAGGGSVSSCHSFHFLLVYLDCSKLYTMETTSSSKVLVTSYQSTQPHFFIISPAKISKHRGLKLKVK